MINRRLFLILLFIIANLLNALIFHQNENDKNLSPHRQTTSIIDCKNIFGSILNCDNTNSIKIDKLETISSLKSADINTDTELSEKDNTEVTENSMEREVTEWVKSISQINLNPLISLMFYDWKCMTEGVRPDLGLTKTTCDILQNSRSLTHSLLMQAKLNPQNFSIIEDEYALYLDLTSKGKHFKTHVIPDGSD